MEATARKTLNKAEIETLRAEFAKIERVCTDRLSDFHAIFDKCADESIVDLAKAGIKFVSKLAVNEASRRGLVVA